MTVVVGTMRFRARDYSAEEAAFSLPRTPTGEYNHPLATRRSTHDQVDVVDSEKVDFSDPLRAPTVALVSNQDVQNASESYIGGLCDEVTLSVKEWAIFKRSLMQKFSFTQTVSVSSMSDVLVKGGKVSEKSLAGLHLEELDDSQKTAEEEVKVITRQEYISRLHKLKDEIRRAWQAEDRVTSLRLTIKVARLLLDTSVSQFYPTIFILVTEVLDMLGDMVWDRIKRKAEYADDGALIYSLPENFKATDVCHEAKETCNNWFCKIGSIRELLPRIYLELAILRCWRFMQDNSFAVIHRLTMMMRGLADPLASAYCHLYMAQCAQTLPLRDMGFLIASFNEITILLSRIISGKGNSKGNSQAKSKLLITLLEPTIEWIMKCIFKDASKWKVNDIFLELGLRRDMLKLNWASPCISIVLHHLLKELPAETVKVNVLDIMQLIEDCKDISFDQYLNYRLLGFKLYESGPTKKSVCVLLDKVFQAVTQYNNLDEYLKVVDAYLDIVLQYQMDNYLSMILDGISLRACNKKVTEDELGSLQSVLIKLLSHFNCLEDAFALNHFIEILDVMYGSARKIVNMHILTKATRNGCFRDPTIIQLLFEISRALHDSLDFSSLKGDDHQQSAHLISRFVQMVDFGTDLERHLTFLIECRRAFGSINEIQETLVHCGNSLAIKAAKDAKPLGFVKSCIAFNEVTIPSISAITGCISLYLETAEVALICGLVSHADGLIDSAISTLQSLELSDGCGLPIDFGGILSSIRKLCGLLVIVPGNPEEGITSMPRNILSLVKSHSWVTPGIRIKVFCGIVSLSATLAQNKLPYQASNSEVVGNDELFFGEPSYYQQLLSISCSILQDLVEALQQEPVNVARGNLALEACNCIISSFKASPEISVVCTELMEIAKSCLHANNRYLQSTVDFLDNQLTTSPRNRSIISNRQPLVHP